MRETRRTLKAENTKLRSQLESHNHVTRASLHDHMNGIVDRNKYLLGVIEKLHAEKADLERKLAEQAQPA